MWHDSRGVARSERVHLTRPAKRRANEALSRARIARSVHGSVERVPIEADSEACREARAELARVVGCVKQS